MDSQSIEIALIVLAVAATIAAILYALGYPKGERRAGTMRAASGDTAAPVSPRPTRRGAEADPSPVVPPVIHPEATVPPQPQPSAAVEQQPIAAPATPAALAQKPDDLTKIKGIGKSIAKRLNQMGVVSYAQMAQWTKEDLDRVDAALAFPGRAQRENWVGQAKALMEKR